MWGWFWIWNCHIAAAVPCDVSAVPGLSELDHSHTNPVIWSNIIDYYLVQCMCIFHLYFILYFSFEFAQLWWLAFFIVHWTYWILDFKQLLLLYFILFLPSVFPVFIVCITELVYLYTLNIIIKVFIQNLVGYWYFIVSCIPGEIREKPFKMESWWYNV